MEHTFTRRPNKDYAWGFNNTQLGLWHKESQTMIFAYSLRADNTPSSTWAMYAASFCTTANRLELCFPIPRGVYYAQECDRFYSAETKEDMGEDFKFFWHSRFKDFPRRLGGL